MKKINPKAVMLRNQTTKEFESMPALVGESAYEIAIRLGTFTGTEKEWNDYIKTERDAAIKAVQDKGTQTLDSIPDDYTTLQEDVNELKGDLAYETGNEIISGYSQGYIELNSLTTDFTITFGNNFKSVVIDCNANDVFTIIYARGSQYTRAWAFCKDDGTLITKAELNTICDYTIIQAPQEATKLCINCYGNPIVCKGVVLSKDYEMLKYGLSLNGFENKKLNIIVDKYLNASTNTIINVAGFSISEPIFVKKGQTVSLVAHGVSTICGMINVCDDENYTNAKAKVKSIDGAERLYSYTLTEDSYVFISYRYKESAYCYSYSFYILEEKNDIYKENQKTIHTQNVVIDRLDFNGKNLVVFGDSIMYGASSGDVSSYNIWTDSWIRRFSAKVGASLTNKAVGGACWTVGTSPDFKDVVTSVHEYCIDSESITPDVIFIGAGTNDWGHDCNIGSYNDTDSSTLYGALRTVFDELKSTYPNVPVVIITPINRTLANTPEKVRFLNEIRNAIFEMAITYDHYVIDGEKMAFPMEKGSYQELMLYDETHPTPLGHILYFNTVYNLLCL